MKSFSFCPFRCPSEVHRINWNLQRHPPFIGNFSWRLIKYTAESFRREGSHSLLFIFTQKIPFSFTSHSPAHTHFNFNQNISILVFSSCVSTKESESLFLKNGTSIPFPFFNSRWCYYYYMESICSSLKFLQVFLQFWLLIYPLLTSKIFSA